MRHKKDKYVGKIINIDDIFVKLDNGRSALKCYVEVIEKGENDDVKNNKKNQ